MPGWLLTLLPYFLTLLQSLLPMLDKAIAELEQTHPAAPPMLDVQTNVQNAVDAIKKAIAVK